MLKPPTNPPTPTSSPDGEPNDKPEKFVIRCRTCGDEFTVEGLPPNNPLSDLLKKHLPTICTPCEDADRAAHKQAEGFRSIAERDARKAADWAAICPDEYADTDLTRLDPVAVAEVCRWQFGPMGLALVGNTGAGKTRLLYHLLKTHHATGRRVKAVSAKALEHGISRRSGDNMADLERYIYGMINVEILAIDDLGKERATERVVSEIYHIVEERTANRRPLIFTTQFSDDEFSEHYGPDAGSAILRRLKQFCRPVPVKKLP